MVKYLKNMKIFLIYILKDTIKLKSELGNVKLPIFWSMNQFKNNGTTFVSSISAFQFEFGKRAQESPLI
jgi:hypothetical protein